MARVSLTFAVLLAAVTLVATAANAAGDPRLCSSPVTQASKLRCGKSAAALAFRRYMQTRFQSRYLWQGILSCRGFAGLLRYRCDFENGGASGYAIVLLGKAPAWKPTVTVKQILCVEDVDRPGCKLG